MKIPLSTGSSGPDVAELQSKLNARPPSVLPPLNVDRIFGPRTLARVQEFQRNNGLSADGIVGRLTLAKLEAASNIPKRTGVDCGNTGQAIPPVVQLQEQPPASSQVTRVNLAGSPSLSISGFVPKLRKLTSAEEASARTVYGGSIDFSSVFISDKLGLGNLPFTASTPIIGRQIMNLGPAAFVSTPDIDTLIHELAHVWQSQHNDNPTTFMNASIDGQAAAVAANLATALIDPSVKANSDFPTHFPFSTYAYVRGKPFSEYGAEQIANQVEHREPPIVAHVRSVASGALDSDNRKSLAGSGRIEDRRIPGVIF
jgi:hypothetical protein